MKYKLIDERNLPNSGFERFIEFWKNALKGELFVGLWIVLREMIFAKSHTLKYPQEKLNLGLRYRGVHKLMRLLKSENERCIGCGLCEKICVSHCITMDTALDENGRKKVANYSINLGRCVYCGLCADVCPEIAIVMGNEYENSSEQRAYYAFKDDILAQNGEICAEFEGYGALSKNGDQFIKKTPLENNQNFENIAQKLGQSEIK